MASNYFGANVQEVVTINDIKTQILTNAEVLFPRDHDFKVITAQAHSGLLYYTTLVADDPKSASVHKEFKIVLRGPGERDRRNSILKLLEETERRAAREILRV